MKQPDYERLRLILDLLVEAVEFRDDDRIVGYGLEFGDAVDDFNLARWEIAEEIMLERERIKALDNRGWDEEDE